MNHCFEILQNLFEQAMTAVRTGDWEAAQKVGRSKNKMRKAQKKFNKAHLERVKRQVCDPSLISDFTAILYGLDRIADNCVGIAEEALDHVVFAQMEELPSENETI